MKFELKKKSMNLNLSFFLFKLYNSEFEEI